MKITTIEAFPIDLSPQVQRQIYQSGERQPASPMARYPKYQGKRSSWMARWPMTGCVVTAEDGTFGFGVTGYSGPVCPIINEHFAEHLVGEDCFATERHFDVMMRISSPYGSIGLASYAISAVDLALWDLKGKLMGRPVYELIGGPQKEKITCYATGFDVDWYRELGFTAFKLPMTHGPVDGIAGLGEAERLVAGAREKVGDSAELMLDCWLAFDVEYTVRLAERLRPYGLRWIEDYLLPEEMNGFAEVRRRLPWQGLATGEHWYLPPTFSVAAENRLVNVFQPDILWCGGLTSLLQITQIAEANGIEVIPHGGMNWPYGQHVIYASSGATWGERSDGVAVPGVPLEDMVRLPGTAVIEDGFLIPSDAPGFGIEIDRAWIDARREKAGPVAVQGM
jgi:L-rhamnonate dehydratase